MKPSPSLLLSKLCLHNHRRCWWPKKKLIFIRQRIERWKKRKLHLLCFINIALSWYCKFNRLTPFYRTTLHTFSWIVSSTGIFFYVNLGCWSLRRYDAVIIIIKNFYFCAFKIKVPCFFLALFIVDFKLSCVDAFCARGNNDYLLCVLKKDNGWKQLC